jgi:hypothetical protein
MRRTKTTILNLFVETFFAVLPLIVLGAVWPNPQERHPESFWSGPELSMTSCILYGLTLARWLQGAVFAAGRRQPDSDQDTDEVAASYAALFLLPLLGVILSVVLIGQSVHSSGTWTIVAIQILNLIAAILAFFVLGGHGIKLSEGGGETE